MRSWKAGPEPGDSRVFLSYTEYTADRFRDLPRIIVVGTRLRAYLCDMDGAVGSWLHATLHLREVGSLSVWRSEDDLRRFVGSPPHVPVMRRYRSRGTLRSFAWWADRYDPEEAWREVEQRLHAATPNASAPAAGP